MRHKHYDLIVEKAANMDLVVFLKNDQGWSLKENQSDIQFHEMFEYFLCLPQHKEACLHWLNGGEIEWTREEEITGCWFGKEKYTLSQPWHEDSGFMLDDNIYRIKPRIEKRWVATINGWNASQKLFATREDAAELLGDDGYQFHEIDVEV